MSDPFSWAVRQRILPRLQAIRIANGYHTDAGANATCEPLAVTPDDPFPRVALVEESAPITAHKPGAINGTIELVAEGTIPADLGEADQTAARLKADITAALARVVVADFADIEGGAVSRFALSGERPTLRGVEGNEYVTVQVRATVTCVEFITP